MKLTPLALLVALALPAAAQTEVTLAPSKDNTLFESETGGLSNGVGSHLFAGRTQGNDLRRALLAFDVAAEVPAGATITAAELTLTMNRSIAGGVPVALHRVTATWGEGASDASGQEGRGGTAAPGDATWLHALSPDAFWDRPGGDFDPTARATASVDGVGAYTWASAGLVADVQAWLDAPASNHGWIAVGDEAATSAKRFASRENADEGARPALRVTYTGGSTAAADGPDGALALRAEPNPFADRTALAYRLAAPAHVTLEVFDAVGRRLAVLVDGEQPAGPHRAALAAEGLPEGVYLVRLRAGGEVQVARVVRGR